MQGGQRGQSEDGELDKTCHNFGQMELNQPQVRGCLCNSTGSSVLLNTSSLSLLFVVYSLHQHQYELKTRSFSSIPLKDKNPFTCRPEERRLHHILFILPLLYHGFPCTFHCPWNIFMIFCEVSQTETALPLSLLCWICGFVQILGFCPLFFIGLSGVPF